jgi:predicted dehydrogenase
MGPIGNLHANIYKEDALAQLVGVCDIVPERAESAGKRLGVPWFTDAQEMLDELAPDLCSVATGGYEYGSDHYEPTMQALSAGCHVLCEKPICNEIPKAERMVALARERGLCFGVDFNHRFTPAARLARKWVDDGRLGEPLFLNMALWIGKPQDFESPYFHLKALNPHSVDTMRYFCGNIKRVQCFAMKAPGRTIWSTASINVQFRNGAVGHLTSSYDIKRGHPMERCEFAGTRGRFVLDDMWREATLYPADSLEKTVYTNPVFGGYRDFDDTFKARLHRFLEQVGENAKPEDIDGTGADGLAAQRVIAAAIKSLDTGEIVNVED